MILQFSFLFYYACAKSSIFSLTVISLSLYMFSAFWFYYLFTIVDNFQYTELRSNE